MVCGPISSIAHKLKNRLAAPGSVRCLHPAWPPSPLFFFFFLKKKKKTLSRRRWPRPVAILPLTFFVPSNT